MHTVGFVRENGRHCDSREGVRRERMREGEREREGEKGRRERTRHGILATVRYFPQCIFRLIQMSQRPRGSLRYQCTGHIRLHPVAASHTLVIYLPMLAMPAYHGTYLPTYHVEAVLHTCRRCNVRECPCRSRKIHLVSYRQLRDLTERVCLR